MSALLVFKLGKNIGTRIVLKNLVDVEVGLRNTECFFSGLELDQWNVLSPEALVTNPLCVDLLREEVESRFVEAGADAVEPEVAARLTEDGLVVVLHLLVAD